ncbi:MAG: hypothetical protein IKE12_00260 [Erysipelotrichaceae bacterium]|nr:hypothetical protein [Erysipelotrichaceae bacterium]
MLYRNIKTGEIVSVATPVTGNWEPVEKQAPIVIEEELVQEKAPVRKTRKKK